VAHDAIRTELVAGARGRFVLIDPLRASASSMRVTIVLSSSSAPQAASRAVACSPDGRPDTLWNTA
jgi:hypothetical protein